MKKYLLNESSYIDLLGDNKIVIVDGGARGNLFPPFNNLNPKILSVLRFDPDPAAVFSGTTSNDKTFHKALWSTKGQIKINIAIEPTSSSVYEFNSVLQKHIDPFADLRKTKSTVEVDSISLDELEIESGPLGIDFIKLDVHGAEYDILLGAQNVLKNTIGLLIESWVIPIHKGQKTRAHVESLAFDNEFYAFEEHHLGKWGRNISTFTKRQPVIVDTLFFKDPMLDNNITDQASAVKLIGIANLFDHNAYALQLAAHFHDQGILDAQPYHMIREHITKYNSPSLIKKAIAKLEKVMLRYSDCSFK